MAFDGITISNIAYDINKYLLGGRIDKIYQPEKDEIVLSVRSIGSNYRLLLTANSSHPRIHFTQESKDNPMQAPMFCMVLRKYLGGGKIVNVLQPQFERILEIHIDSLNEMGDMSTKRLIIEIMGKHSNIIVVDDNSFILDSIKHISHEKSSVREVLPGKKYVLPPSKDKLDPTMLALDEFVEVTSSKSSLKIQSMIYQSYNGISPVMASEICTRAGLSEGLASSELTSENKKILFQEFKNVMQNVQDKTYAPEVIYDENKNIVEFSSIPMTMFHHFPKKYFDDISTLLSFFYTEKDVIYRSSQKTQDLRKLVQIHIDRCIKKKEVYEKTLKDIANRDKKRLYGELITSNIYSIKQGMTSFTTVNFYDESLPEITITLDPEYSPTENAQKYFKRYNKEKRTYSALQEQITQNEEELSYLDGLMTFLMGNLEEADVDEIRQELSEGGFIKKHKPQGKKAPKQKKSKPLRFKSSDGFEIYVGKNNKQNDELTLHFATNADIWLHTKEIPGSHVIIKTNGEEVPSTTLTEAANLAAYYSKAQNGSLVPVDYTFKKHVKKPNGAKPGMVIYETNKTAFITPDKELIEKLAGQS